MATPCFTPSAFAREAMTHPNISGTSDASCCGADFAKESRPGTEGSIVLMPRGSREFSSSIVLMGRKLGLLFSTLCLYSGVETRSVFCRAVTARAEAATTAVAVISPNVVLCFNIIEDKWLVMNVN